MTRSCVAAIAATGLAFSLVIAAPGTSRAAPTCVDLPAAGQGRLPVDPNCCKSAETAARFPSFTCPGNAAAPGLQAVSDGSDPADPRTRPRKNVLLVIPDDVGYCMVGFQLGRCVQFHAHGDSGPRCSGRVCSNAPWIQCGRVADCPPAECGEPAPTCRLPVDEVACACRCTDDGDCASGTCNAGVCSSCTACTGDGECASGECTAGLCVPADDGCHSGFCSRCAMNADCNDPNNPADDLDICIDGQCSPRANCSGGGDFACAHRQGACVETTPGSGKFGCANYQGGSCTGDEQCGAGRICLNGTCTNGCSNDTDCNDTCETNATCVNGTCAVGGQTTGVTCTADADCVLCRNTPSMCASNHECADSYVCGRGDNPLRIDDLACRYRRWYSRNTTTEWQYSPGTDPDVDPLIYTPTLDALAAEGMVFTRARVGGQHCNQSRQTLITGRVMRHRNFMSDTAGQCRAESEWTHDEPVECAAPGVDATCDSGWCDQWHALPFWTQGSAVTGEPYMSRAYSISVGKVQLTGEGMPDFDEDVPPVNKSTNSFGKFQCDLGSSCQGDLKAGRIPRVAFDSVQDVVDAIQGLIGSDGQDLEPAGPDKKHLPFFMWYGPEFPHDGGASEFFKKSGGLYDQVHELIAAMSNFDAGTEALFDEIKNTCVCGPSGKDSLWNNTVVVVLPDHGKLLEESKNAARPTENSRRVPMIIWDPETGGHVFDSLTYHAGFYDLMPTILDFLNGYGDGAVTSGGTADRINRYPLAKNLRPLLEDADTDGGSGDRLEPPRNVAYGADIASGFDPVHDGAHRWAVARGGFIGICDTTPGNTALLCRSDTDCPGTTCRHAFLGSTGKYRGRICVDGSFKACESDADCGGTCDGGLCTGGIYHDFKGDSPPDETPCVTNADCVPQGICRPPLLKVKLIGTTPVREAYELQSDPDQQSNLVSTLPQSLVDTFASCISEFFHVTPPEDDSHAAWIAPTTSNCPAAFRTWQACSQNGCPECCVIGGAQTATCANAAEATTCEQAGGQCLPMQGASCS